MSQPSAPPSYGEAVTNKNFGSEQPAYSPGSAPYPTSYGGPQPNYGYQYNSATPQAYPPGEIYPSAPQPAGYAPQPYSPPTEAAVYQPTSGHPAEAGDETGGFSVSKSFDNKDVRRMFIRKVFIILGIQLLVTFGIVCIFTLVDDVKVYVRANPGWYYASYAIFLVLYFVLICVESARRKHPQNLIILGLFTLALSYMTGTIAAFYSTQSVMIALGVTVLVCTAVILFSMQTKFDFTKCSGVLFVLLLVLMIFGFITIFTYSRPWYLQVVYGCLGALVFTLFLAFDTQLIMGGRKYEMSPDEYVFGALNLYIDVVYIFLFLLAIFGGSNN